MSLEPLYNLEKLTVQLTLGFYNNGRSKRFSELNAKHNINEKFPMLYDV
jgi:hypothetical protein